MNARLRIIRSLAVAFAASFALSASSTVYVDYQAPDYIAPTASKTAPASHASASLTYKVVFSANGGKGKMSSQTIACGKSVKLKKNAFSKSGHVFAGWAKKKNGAVAFKNRAAVKDLAAAGKTVTLYAKWAKKNYKVKFVANGGKGAMSAQKMVYGKSAKLNANKFKRSGFVFAGWAKKKNGAVAFKNKAAVKNLTTTGKTVKLYAQWAKKNYKVKFFANGGKGKMAVQKMVYGKSAKLKANKFKRTGYKFAGWAKTKKGAVAFKNKKAVKNLTTTGKTVKLYAVWNKKKAASKTK